MTTRRLKGSFTRRRPPTVGQRVRFYHWFGGDIWISPPVVVVGLEKMEADSILAGELSVHLRLTNGGTTNTWVDHVVPAEDYVEGWLGSSVLTAHLTSPT